MAITQDLTSAGTQTVQGLREGLGNIQNLRNSADSYVDNLAGKSTVKAKTQKGISGFVFDYLGKQEVNLQADITDHYLEDGSFINDNVIIKPVYVTLSGFIAEQTYSFPGGILGLLQTVQNKLGAVPSFLGGYTPTQLQQAQSILTKAQSALNQVDYAIAKAQNIVDMFPGAAPQLTKQQKAYAKISAMLNSKQICTVETPYKVFPSMVIERVTMIQDADSKYISDISVTLKEIRIATTEFSAAPKNFNKNIMARATDENHGNTKGKSIAASLVDSGGSFLRNASKIFNQ